MSRDERLYDEWLTRDLPEPDDEPLMCDECGGEIGMNGAAEVYNLDGRPMCKYCYRETIWDIYSVAPMTAEEFKIIYN